MPFRSRFYRRGICLLPAAKQQIPRAIKLRFGMTILWGMSNGLLLLLFERVGVELHDFAHVGQEISQAVVAGVQVILVLHAFRLELPM